MPPIPRRVVKAVCRAAFAAGLAAPVVAACSPKTGEPGSQISAGTGGTHGAGSGGASTAQGMGGVPFMSSAGGASQNPPPGIIVIPDSGAGAKTDAGCGGLTVQGETIPLDMLIMFDQSKSMSCPIPSGGDRWAAVKTALKSFMQNQGAAGIDVGLSYFGAVKAGVDPLVGSCNPYDYETPDVEFTALPMGAPTLVGSLDGHTPATNTPTVAALTGAINHAASWKADHLGHTVIVVLVTDGQPNSCGTGAVSDVVTAATRGFMVGSIPTYMIGILSPGSACTLDPNQPNQADLDSVAAAGGTDKALVVDTTKDTGQQLLDTMNKIRQNAQIPCEYTIPPPRDGEKLDYEKVNVGYDDPSKQKQEVYYVQKSTSCDPAKGGGWYYDSEDPLKTKPTKILLCPTTCTTVTAKFGYQVNITVGCATHRPPA